MNLEKPGRFELDGLLGEGGMGAVYAARGPLMFRVVEEESVFEKTRAEVMVECRALSEVLSHENDRYVFLFLRTGRDRMWRPAGVRRAGS